MSIYLKSVGLTSLYTLSLPIQEGFYQTFFEVLNILYMILRICGLTKEGGDFIILLQNCAFEIYLSFRKKKFG